MKMNLKNIIFILGVLFLGSSCENFLDVHPKGEVTGKELLKDRKGFENALYGVYATMRNQTLYGRYLSYYTLDVMAQYYTSFGNTYVSELRAFNYKQTDVETEFYNIWCKMYNNISNVNNILENLWDYVLLCISTFYVSSVNRSLKIRRPQEFLMPRNFH